ncbi:hypothetical protein AB0H42_33635 [Nocardia sp. NPDC050799]|uniref:hypothetical protein n=1 Tax=Nocardia sp. NPDC050799 TaxID=3154842 RepID=UPI0033D18956
MYKALASSLPKREAALVERYLDEQRTLDEHLAAEYQAIMLDQSMSDYLGLLERAFSPDVQVAFVGSVELTAQLGVASDESWIPVRKSTPTSSASERKAAADAATCSVGAWSINQLGAYPAFTTRYAGHVPWSVRGRSG